MIEMNISLSSVLAKTLKGKVPALVRVDGGGCISVFPEQNCYITDITDWDAVFGHSVSEVSSDPALRITPLAHALPVSELHWRSAYHEALSHQSVGATSWDLFQLVSWPNLGRLPEELVVPVTRICALLWRKPTVGFLVPRVLAMPAPQALALLSVLSSLGHVTQPRCAGHIATLDAEGRATAAELQSHAMRDAMSHEADFAAQIQPSVSTKANSLVSKLWQRLVGR